MLETASHDLQTLGLAEPGQPMPCTLVIIGGGGDLAQRKLLPAIYNIAFEKLLPESSAVVGFGRRDISDEAYRALARKSIEAHSRRPFQASTWDDRERSLFFVTGNYTSGVEV